MPCFIEVIFKSKILRNMTFSAIMILLAAACSALMAGLFFAYSYSVVLGFKSLTDAQYIAAMQSINRAIQNPVFFIVFFGCLILLPVNAWLNFTQPISTRFWYLLAAAILYIAGVFCVTAFGNVPLNNMLDKFDLLNSTQDVITSQRIQFEAKWNLLNNIRTISSVVSLLLVILACMNQDKN